MGDRLKDRVALVFGAGSSGPGWSNGKAAAVSYAREGALAVCADIDRAAAEETRGVIAAEGGRAVAVACDATSGAAVADAVARAMAERGRIDVLHNNVGHAALGGPAELDEAAWRREIDLNLNCVFLACKHVLPIMAARGKGAVVNISSIAALRYTGYDYASYYAAKGAVNQLTVGLALQYARAGIRVNAVCPGLMDTPMVRRQLAGAHDNVEAMLRERHAAAPTGRMGTAWDVANASVFLASDEAAYITAVCLPVDGGLSARAR